MSVTVDITDQVSGMVRNLSGELQSGRVNPVIGRSLVNLVRNNFYKLNAERANKLGGERTNFYANAAKATSFEAGVDSVTVSVNQIGIRQRLQGGTIKPVHAKYLTIPAIAEAYGKRAREFNNLQVLFGKGGKPVALGTRETTVGKGKNARTSPFGQVYFLLVKSVTQRADPTVLPSESELVATALQAAGSYFARLAERRSA